MSASPTAAPLEASIGPFGDSRPNTCDGIVLFKKPARHEQTQHIGVDLHRFRQSVVDCVARRMFTTSEAILGRSQAREATIPRHVCFAIMRYAIPGVHVFTQVSDVFGRGRATFMIGCQRTYDRGKRDPKIFQAITLIISDLKAMGYTLNDPLVGMEAAYG